MSSVKEAMFAPSAAAKTMALKINGEKTSVCKQPKDLYRLLRQILEAVT